MDMKKLEPWNWLQKSYGNFQRVLSLPEDAD